MSWSYKRPHGDEREMHPRHQQQRYNSKPSPTELQVVTNQYKLMIAPDTSNSSDIIQYKVTMMNRRCKKVKDEATGEETREWYSEEIGVEDMEKFVKTPFPWRIMKKLVKEHNFLLAYDGDMKAYSKSTNLRPLEKKEYEVKVKRDCEENDPDADKVPDRTFRVKFKETKRIPFADVVSASPSEEIVTMLNVIAKSNQEFTEGIISLEPNSSAQFFPLEEQMRLLSGKAATETKDRTKVMLSGLKTTAVAKKGGVFIETESIVKYANKEFIEQPRMDQRHRDGASRVPLLNLDNQTIAGVHIKNFHVPVDEHDLRLIEVAIGKLGRLNIEYRFRNTKTGKDERRLCKNKPFRKDGKEDSNGCGKRIIRSAEDLIFNDQDGREWTVAAYFENRYGIKLQYPNMPIIYLDNTTTKFGGAWYPCEFIFQAFGRSKDNGGEIVNNKLRYHDAVAGKKYIDEVGMKLDELSITGRHGASFAERMMDWRIQIGTRPVEETAKVLKPPLIHFGNMKSLTPNNGSFNLLGAQLSRPAKLSSFVIANFTTDRNTSNDEFAKNKRSCYNFVKTVIRVANGHEMDIPSVVMDMALQDQYLDLVTVHYNGQDPVGDALDTIAMAIQKAKKFHLYDSHRVYRKNNVFYHTHCFSEEEVEFECLVLPPDNLGDKLGLLLQYNKVRHFFSHRIVTYGGSKHDVRLMVKIKEDPTALIDPLDFRFHNDRHQAMWRWGKENRCEWKDVTFDQHCYFCPEPKKVFSEREIRSKTFKHFADDWVLDFPSMVFAYKPTDEKPLWQRIKVASNHLGMQTQCAVMETWDDPKMNQDQYASNVAAKLVAKLSTINDKAVSWTSTYLDGDRSGNDMLPWVGDAPTMVLGLGMAHGIGKNTKSVIAASLCLDGGCMRLSHSCLIQRKTSKKSYAIEKYIMQDIVKGSIERYVNENGHYPERLLLHRDGLSDENFKQADVEIEWIKEAMEEKVGSIIPVTFVICQSQQLGFRMAPFEDQYIKLRNGKQKLMANVPSGTVLDCGPNSFYIITQGGVKGTSKPVKYIIYLNENERPVNGRNGLTLQNLKDCTYQMCFKYATATKAVRELPTIKYAKRIANQVLSSLPCLEVGFSWFDKYIKLVCPEGDTLTEEESRPYLEILNERREPIYPEHRQYNIVDMPFRNHLAA